MEVHRPGRAGFSFKPTETERKNNLSVNNAAGAQEALVVYRFPFGNGEVRAYFQKYGDAMLAHIRRFQPQGENRDYRPTTKGIAVSPEDLNNLLIAVANLVANKEKVLDERPEELPM
jgi:hypothetical protein